MAMGWLIYRLTDSELMLGMIWFAMRGPSFLFSPIAGALVDRMDARRLTIAIQTMDMITMSVLGLITIGGHVQVWHILACCCALGITKAFDVPVRQTLVVQIINQRSDLPNAIALTSAIFNAAGLTGPMLGGAVLWLASTPIVKAWLGEGQGEGLCFLVDAISFVAVIGSVIALRIIQKPPVVQRQPLLKEMKDGFVAAFGFVPIRDLLLLITAVGLLAGPYNTLLPAIARDVLAGDEQTYSLLMAAGGIGAIIGAIYLARRPTVLGLGKIIAAGTTFFGSSLVLFAFSTNLWISALLLVAAALGYMIILAGSNTVIQTLVDDSLRGRVMSLYGMTFMGSIPVGALLAGKFASMTSAPLAIGIGGLACIICGLIFATRLPSLLAKAKPIYAKRGVMQAETTAAAGN